MNVCDATLSNNVYTRKNSHTFTARNGTFIGQKSNFFEKAPPL